MPYIAWSWREDTSQGTTSIPATATTQKNCRRTNKKKPIRS